MENGLAAWLAARMREPSTWVGIGSMLTAAGWQVAPEYWQQIAVIGMGAGGLIGAVVGERRP